MIKINQKEIKHLLSDEEVEFLAELYMEIKNNSKTTFEKFINQYSQNEIKRFLKIGRS